VTTIMSYRAVFPTLAIARVRIDYTCPTTDARCDGVEVGPYYEGTGAAQWRWLCPSCHREHRESVP
jgi:hypothetical protein